MELFQAFSFYAANADNINIPDVYLLDMEKQYKRVKARERLPENIRKRPEYPTLLKRDQSNFIVSCDTAKRVLDALPSIEPDPLKIIPAKPVFPRDEPIGPTGVDITETTTIPPSETDPADMLPGEMLSKTDLTGAPADEVTKIFGKDLEPGTIEYELESEYQEKEKQLAGNVLTALAILGAVYFLT